MPKRVQMVRQTQSVSDIYVGLDGQWTIDVTNYEPRIHDGANAGGIKIARQDLANVADATGANAGKMSATQAGNLAQVIADLAALAATGVSFDDTGVSITAANVQLAIAAVIALVEGNDTDIASNLSAINAHIADTGNPHSVTAAQAAALAIASNLSDLQDVATALTNLGIDAAPDAAYIAGTSVEEDLVSPAKIRTAINSFLNWPAGVEFIYASATPPAGSLALNGQEISRTTHSALFALYGTTHGIGDGSTTFALPDFRDNVAVGAGTTYADGNTGGADTVALTVPNLPSGKIAEVSISPTSEGAENSGRVVTGNNVGGAGLGPYDVISDGTDTPVDIRQKYIARNWFVTTGGV